MSATTSMFSAIFAGVLAIAAPALAKAPSEKCRDGAALCKDAYDKFEKCEASNPDKPENCKAERAETDAACKSTSSACHKDGSRHAGK